MKKKPEKREFVVIKGEFGNGDPIVKRNFAEALAKIEANTGGSIKAFGIVVVHGDNCVGTVYDEGESYHPLVSGIRTLENRIFRELYEDDEHEGL